MQIFATFGLLILLQNIVLAMTRGASLSINAPISSLTVSVGPIQVSLVRLVTLAAAALVALGLVLVPAQHACRAAPSAPSRRTGSAARLMGINVERTFMLTFGIGAALAGLAGTLLTPIYTLSPQIGGNFIVAAFAVVVLGGLGSVTGAFIGGFVVGFTEAIAGLYIDPALKHAVWFSVFIVMLLVRPSGLFGHVGAEEVGLREQH